MIVLYLKNLKNHNINTFSLQFYSNSTESRNALIAKWSKNIIKWNFKYIWYVIKVNTNETKVFTIDKFVL
jgi:hypothetical protein